MAGNGVDVSTIVEDEIVSRCMKPWWAHVELGYYKTIIIRD